MTVARVPGVQGVRVGRRRTEVRAMYRLCIIWHDAWSHVIKGWFYSGSHPLGTRFEAGSSRGGDT